METGGKDTTDARGAVGYTTVSTISSAPRHGQDGPSTAMGSSSDMYRYNMSHRRRGLAIIINNETFDPSLKLGERTGTDRDADDMDSLLSTLGFRVMKRKNCTATQMRAMLAQAAREDHRDADCFACVILSHGEDKVVYSTDGEVQVQDLVAPIKGCKSLAGKPKLFFLQACRGKQVDDGVEVVDAKGTRQVDDDEEEMETDAVTVHTIPVEADFLMAYSVVPGYYSWRNTADGSWFVQALVSVVRESWRDMDLLTMLTRVAHRVAYRYQSNVPDKAHMHRKKQIPCITSMLTKDLYFTPKM